MDIGCIYFGTNVNLLAYADDLVLLAPSWWALQSLLDVLAAAASKIMMTFNTSKTTFMVFNLCNRSKTVSNFFPQFTLSGCKLKFVEQFKYLEHLTHNSFTDDNDINREIKAMFTRTNMLCRVSTIQTLFDCRET